MLTINTDQSTAAVTKHDLNGVSQTDLANYQSLRSRIIEAGGASVSWMVKLCTLLEEMRDSKLYKVKYSRWSDFCQSLHMPGFEGLTGPRADQLIRHVKVQDRLFYGLIDAGVNTEITENVWQLNEATTRELSRLPEEQQIAVAEQMLTEREYGERQPSAPRVKEIAAELAPDGPVATLSDVQALYRPWGEFKPHVPINAKAAMFKYELSREGKTIGFASLEKAIDWYLQNLQPTAESCISCSHCDQTREGLAPGEIWCSSRNHDVGYRQYKVMPGQCGSWTDGEVELQLKPVEVKKQGHPAGVLASGAKADENPEKNERYSPEELWRPALRAEGIKQFDLDPSTCDRSPVPARVKYTRQNNGLAHDWIAKVMWGNFPFEFNLEFARKMVREFASGNIEAAYLALKTDHSTEWWQTLFEACTAICLVNHRVSYLNTDQTSFFPTTIFYFGSDLEKFSNAYRHLGMIVTEVVITVEVEAIPNEEVDLLAERGLYPAKTYADPTEYPTARADGDEDPEELWSQVGDIQPHPKYQKNGGFQVVNEQHGIHLEFQSAREARLRWHMKGQGLLDAINAQVA